MGLAASQARLLSITSRMSDNELRSQLINNAKMRLTTDSARVSDEYIAALNRTQMMFTNFDVFGNELYQNLTFNALTAYSSYNNQYGIVNNGGEILVSELDANNFEMAGGDLNKFLESYGLEQKTSYFETLATSQEFTEWGIGYYDNFNKWQQFDIGVDELQAMYEGTVDANGIEHYGLQPSYNSVEYQDYLRLVEGYHNAKGAYDAKLFEATHTLISNETASTDIWWHIPVVGSGTHTLSGYTFQEAYDNVFSFISRARTYIEEPTSLPKNEREHDFAGHHGANGEYNVWFNGGFSTTDRLGTKGIRRLINQYVDCVYDIMRDTIGCNGAFTPCNVNGTGGAFGPITQGQNSLLSENGNEFLEKISGYLGSMDRALYHSDDTNSYTYHGIGADNKVQGYVILDEDGNPTTICKSAADFDTMYLYNNGTDGDDMRIAGYIGDYYDMQATIPGSGEYDKVLYIDAFTNGANNEPLYYRDYDPSVDTDSNRVVEIDGTNYYLTWESLERYDENGEEIGTWSTRHPQLYQFNVNPDDNYSGVLIKDNSYGLDDVLLTLGQLYTAMANELPNYLDEDKIRALNADLQTLFMEYKDSAEALAKFIWGDEAGHANIEDMFGANLDKKYYEHLDDPSWILADPSGITVSEEGEEVPNSIHYNPYYLPNNTTTNFPEIVEADLDGDGIIEHISYQAVKDIFILESMLAHYGEPVYTWIDVNNPEENGQAKATWYTNLFNRMLEGYEIIGNGLASSPDWIQFAFESGLVHMEQVNKSSEWVSTMYSNCSGITESMVDVDVTLAEAKYKREMAKIEAKDKKYDMELKNIDTEHESLKQEYESIKKVIAKNIDRNFKMFQQA